MYFGTSPLASYGKWLLMASLLVIVGCSDHPKTYPIEGKIVFSDGTPVQFGEIETLQSDLKLNARGKIRKDGTFDLGTFADADGVVEGVHKVVVTQFSASHLSGNVKFDTIEHSHGHDIDSKYSSYQTSPLEFEIKPGVTTKVELEITDFAPAKNTGHH